MTIKQSKCPFFVSFRIEEICIIVPGEEWVEKEGDSGVITEKNNRNISRIFSSLILVKLCNKIFRDNSTFSEIAA